MRGMRVRFLLHEVTPRNCYAIIFGRPQRSEGVLLLKAYFAGIRVERSSSYAACTFVFAPVSKPEAPHFVCFIHGFFDVTLFFLWPGFLFTRYLLRHSTSIYFSFAVFNHRSPPVLLGFFLSLHSEFVLLDCCGGFHFPFRGLFPGKIFVFCSHVPTLRVAFFLFLAGVSVR